MRARVRRSRHECRRRRGTRNGFGGDAGSGAMDGVCRRSCGKDEGAWTPEGRGRVISVLVLTKNEEQDLPGCLASVSWSDDVHVLDSMSTDRTIEIAREHGAQVTERAFDNWAAHQNWALVNVDFRHPWVFYID